MNIKELCATLERRVPPLDGCEDYDGIALMPRPEKEVHRVAVALDADLRTAAMARDAGAELLLTHHPLFYGGEPEVGSPQYLAGKLLSSHGIAAMSLHARLDAADGGMNDSLCRILNIFDTGTIRRFGIPVPGEEELGRIGMLQSELSLTGKELAAHVKKTLGAPAVTLTCPERRLRRVAVVSGSSSDFVSAAHDAGADAIIGGEFKYHTLEYADALGISCIGAGHYYTERHAAALLRDILSAISDDITVYIADPGCPASVI